MSQLGKRCMLLPLPVMWLRASHATKFKPNVTLWLCSTTEDEDYGQENQATHQLTRAKSKKKNPQKSVGKTSLCDQVCVCVCLRVCVVGNGNVWELGAQAGVCPVRTWAYFQRHRGGLADPSKPALPDLGGLHQAGGPRRGQVCHLDPGE